MLRRALLATAAVVVLLPAAPTGAATQLKCPSADLRYPFREGGPNDFGVFRLRIENGNCAAARRIAKVWMKRFEANLDAGRVRLPKRVRGFRFKTLAPHAAQTYTERGIRFDTTIRFDYVVPNG